MESTRVDSGIPNLNSLIEGGFEKKSTNLIVGGSGTGKSIISIQFLIAGMQKNEKCLYVTFEEKKSEVYENMKRFGWDLDKYEKMGLFVFLEYTPEKVKTMLEEGGGAIENIIVKNKISRMVIDSITSFELLFEKELEKREAAFALFNMISGWNCTALLTYESDAMKESTLDHRTLEFECDSIILLYHTREKTKRQRSIEVLKMRGTEHSTDLYKFEITKEGVIVDKKPYRGASVKKSNKGI